MPIYEHKCDRCSFTVERIEKHDAAPLGICPVCGKGTLKRQVSATKNFELKGDGFYKPSRK